MITNLVNSGYAFLKQVSDTETIYENKFTGLWVRYNSINDSYIVIS